MTFLAKSGTRSSSTACVRPSRMNTSGSKPVTQSAVHAPHSRHSYIVTAQPLSIFMPRSSMDTCSPLARGVLFSLPVTSSTGHR